MTIERLQVLWIDDDRRARHRIGRLSRAAGVYSFAYVEDVTSAAQKGFTPLPEFPDLARVYTAPKLFVTFADRVPSKKRPDRERIVTALGLAADAGDFDILARSGGILATDSVELAEDRDPDDDLCRPLTFRVAGARRYPQTRPLTVGEALTVTHEAANEYDHDACVLVRETGEKAGYIPKAYSDLVARACDAGRHLRVELIAAVSLEAQPDPQWVATMAVLRG